MSTVLRVASIGISTEISCTGNEPVLTEEQKIAPPEQEPTATEDGNENTLHLLLILYFTMNIYCVHVRFICVASTYISTCSYSSTPAWKIYMLVKI